MQLVEPGHQQGRNLVRNRPQGAEHTRRSESGECPGQADELVGIVVDVIEPGFAGREHDEARPAEPVGVHQPADRQPVVAVHDERGQRASSHENVPCEAKCQCVLPFSAASTASTVAALVSNSVRASPGK